MEKAIRTSKEIWFVFDRDVVAEMIQIMEYQREMLVRTRKSLHVRKQEVKTLQNAIGNHKQEVEKTKNYYENLLAAERMNEKY